MGGGDRTVKPSDLYFNEKWKESKGFLFPDDKEELFGMRGRRLFILLTSAIKVLYTSELLRSEFRE